MIINGNAVNGEKIFRCTRDMQKISKMNWTMRGFNNCVTNMTDLHTFSTRGVDVILAAVFFPHGHLLQLTGDVVGSTAVDVPICVDAIGAISRRSDFLLILRVIIVLFIPILAVLRCVSGLAADLAPRGVRAVSTPATSSASTATTAARLGWCGATASVARPALVAR